MVQYSMVWMCGIAWIDACYGLGVQYAVDGCIELYGTARYGGAWHGMAVPWHGMGCCRYGLVWLTYTRTHANMHT